MRIWDLPVAALADKQLNGEHRELHCIWAVMGTDRGYSRHPETLRWIGHRAALRARHEEQVNEMRRRGWPSGQRHASPLPRVQGPVIAPAPITPLHQQRKMLAERGGLQEANMGLFSWDCKHCGHPALSEYSANEKNRWMRHVVVFSSGVDPDDCDLPCGGGMVFGLYDGYGRVSGVDILGDDYSNDPVIYHTACWLAAGRPTTFDGPSESSADQGHFFDDPEHDMDPPIANWSDVFDDWLLMGDDCDVESIPARIPPGVMV